MKVTNKTDYDTRALHQLFMQCEKHEGTGGKGRDVTVLKSKRRRVHGVAWFHSRYINMYLPKNTSTRSIARVYIHELGHNLGLHHKDMTCINNIDTSWLDELYVPLKKSEQNTHKRNLTNGQRK